MVTVPGMGLGQIKHTGAGTTPTQNFATSADMFGSVQAREANKLGALITKEVNKEIRAEDERASMEIEQQIRDWSFEATQGDDGVYRKRGGGAIGSTKAIQENYTKFSSKLLQGKTVSSAARKRIEGYISQKGDGIRNEVSRYERSQKAVYDNGLREARIQGAQEDAIYYSDDPEKITASLDMIKITHKRSASENGWSSDEAKQQLEDDISKLHMGVIKGLLNRGKGSQAAEYLEVYEDQIDGDDIGTATRMVDSANEKVSDQTISADVFSKYPAEKLTEGLKHITDTYEGDERDRLISRYSGLVSKQKTAEAVEDDAVFDRSLKMARDGEIDQISEADKIRLVDSGQWGEVGKAHQSIGSGTLEYNDYDWLQKEYWSKAPRERKNVPLSTLKKHMNYDTYNKEKADRMKSGVADYTQDFNSYTTSRLLDAGLDPKESKDDDDVRSRMDGFYTELDTRSNAIRDKSGIVTEKERREIVRDLTREIVIDLNWAFDIGNSLAEWDTADWQNAASETGVPVEVLPRVIRKLQGRGDAVTNSTIKEAYKRGKE